MDRKQWKSWSLSFRNGLHAAGGFILCDRHHLIEALLFPHLFSLYTRCSFLLPSLVKAEYPPRCCVKLFPCWHSQAWLSVTVHTTRPQYLGHISRCGTTLFLEMEERKYVGNCISRAGFDNVTGRLCLFRHLDLRASTILSLPRQ